MKKLVLLVILSICFLSNIAYSEGLESIGILSGYMSGDLKQKDDYQLIPIMVSFGFDMKPLAEKIGINTKGILEFQIEPFLNPVFSPDAEIEAGVSFLIKYAFPLNEKLMPYLKFGAGPSFMSLDTREQGTKFNFVDSAAAGFSWFLKEDLTLDVEYRFRHLSNCSVDEPNGGINTQSILMGLSFRFE